MNEYSELLEFAMSSAVSAPFFQPLEQNLPTVGIRLNALNRPVSLSSANSVDQFFYDLLGRATNRIDAASNPWKTEYDALSRPINSIRPTGAEEQTSYDSQGNRTEFINAENKPITFGFDTQGRITAITNAIGKVTEYSHDLNGNIISRRDAEGAETLYNYDEMNRLIRVDSSNSWAGFDYDLNSNLTEASNQTSEVSFNYDSMNRLSSSTSFVSLVSFVVQNSFDLNGNRTNIVYPGGLVVGYEYDEENRLESVTTKYTNDTKTTSFAYDGASRLTGMSYPNGVNSTFGYDAESRILEYAYSSGSSNFLRHVIQRDPRGFKTIEDTYAGLLPNFTNEVHQTRTHNDADQLLSTGDTDYQYNANGCLTSSVTSAQSVDYSYDFDNRLTSANDVEYLYDASGVRVARIAGVSPAAVTNYFVVDYTDPLKRPLAETDSSGTITRYYIWAGFQLLAHIEADGVTRYYHSDEIGSTLALTDEAGVVTDQFAYSPYGQVLGRTGPTDTPYQWLGGYGVYYDAYTDLHLTLYRAYSAMQKRFISSDPLGIDGGVNLYAYGNLNPLFFVDPLGQRPFGGGDDGWTLGRKAWYSPIKPGEGVGAALETYGYAMETMSKIHDPLVGILVPELGDGIIATGSEMAIDTVVNIPSMPPSYVAAVGYETAALGVKVGGGIYDGLSTVGGSASRAIKGVYNFFTGGNENAGNPPSNHSHSSGVGFGGSSGGVRSSIQK